MWMWWIRLWRDLILPPASSSPQWWLGDLAEMRKGAASLQVGRRAYLLHGEQGCWPAEPKKGEGDLLLSKTVPGKMKEWWEKLISRQGWGLKDYSVMKRTQSELARNQDISHLEAPCCHFGVYKGSKLTWGCYATACWSSKFHIPSDPSGPVSSLQPVNRGCEHSGAVLGCKGWETWPGGGGESAGADGADLTRLCMLIPLLYAMI